jgi:hypothetical protein
MLLLKLHDCGNLPRQCKKHRYYVFGDNGTVNLAGVGENYSAVQQLGEHELVDGRGLRMNPAEIVRREKLISAE